MKLSILIPVYNEENNVGPLYSEIIEAMKPISINYEIIFIDDGSTDRTTTELKKLKKVKIIEFRKNFGQTAALDAGIKLAEGKYIATLDGDMQNDPADIPTMLSILEMNENVDFICGWRKDRKDSFSKKFISRCARFFRNILIKDGVKDSGCTLRVYKRECFEELNLRGEMHRFIVALLKWRGFKHLEIVVNHRKRLSGESKYTLTRTIKSFLDMLSLWFFRKYSSRPIHILGTIGLFFILIGFFLAISLLVYKVFYGTSFADSNLPLASVFFLLFGIQMFISGLTMRLITSISGEKHYKIRSIHQ